MGCGTQPSAIREVVLANGTVDTHENWGHSKRTRVLSDGEAAVVTKILEENVQYGTGTRAGIGRPAAGKTGTTTDNADAWFVGYVPQLDTAVWVGYPGGEVPMQDVHGIAVSGGSFPAEIWKAYMEQALAKTPVVDFPQPSKLAGLEALPSRAVRAELRPERDHDGRERHDAPHGDRPGRRTLTYA